MMLNLGKNLDTFRTKDLYYDGKSKKCLIIIVGSWNYVIVIEPEDYFMNKPTKYIFINHTVFKWNNYLILSQYNFFKFLMFSEIPSFKLYICRNK